MHLKKLICLLAISAIIVTALLLISGVLRKRRNDSLSQNSNGRLSNASTSRQNNVIGLSETNSIHRKESQSPPNDPDSDHNFARMQENSQLKTDDRAALGALFGESLHLIQDGRFKEGENAFLQFIRKSSEEPGAAGPARLATQLKQYKAETLEVAASCFREMTITSSDLLSDGQLKSAQFVIATIYVELTSAPENLETRKQYTLEAQKEIRSFLEKWPDGLMSLSLRLSLARLEQSIG